MPPHHCCSLCTCESTSSAGISLHCQSCSKYKTHILTVFQLKNWLVSQAGANIKSTRGLTQTLYSQQQELGSSMQIDDMVSLYVFTILSESTDSCLNSCVYSTLR